MELTVKNIVNGNTAKFSFYRNGIMFYTVELEGTVYTFPVPLDDIGSATLLDSFKAITLMRYIRKALADGTFIAQGGANHTTTTDSIPIPDALVAPAG